MIFELHNLILQAKIVEYPYINDNIGLIFLWLIFFIIIFFYQFNIFFFQYLIYKSNKILILNIK